MCSSGERLTAWLHSKTIDAPRQGLTKRQATWPRTSSSIQQFGGECLQIGVREGSQGGFPGTPSGGSSGKMPGRHHDRLAGTALRTHSRKVSHITFRHMSRTVLPEWPGPCSGWTSRKHLGLHPARQRPRLRAHGSVAIVASAFSPPLLPDPLGTAAMFGAGAPMTFGGSAPAEPLTTDAAANEFAAKAGLTVEVEQQVRALEMPMRLRVLSVLAAKVQQGPVQNNSSYLAGIIRNEIRQSPYKANWSPPSCAPSDYQNVCGPQSSSRAVATPQQSPRQHAKAPAWAAELFSLSSRPTVFLRKMHELLGGEGMAQIGIYPMHVQVSLLMALVLSPSAWSDPVSSFKALLVIIKDMPPIASAGPCRAMPRSGRPLVIIQLGSAIGAEWVMLKNALENVKGDFSDIRVEARHAFRGNASGSAFYEAIMTAVQMEGTLETHTQTLQPWRQR